MQKFIIRFYFIYKKALKAFYLIFYQIKYDKAKPYLIGLTGGLASGKSTVRKELEKLSLATIDCDKLGNSF